jgi:magnesium transporter
MIFAIIDNPGQQRVSITLEDPPEIPSMNYLWIDMVAPTDLERSLVEIFFCINLLSNEEERDLESRSKIFYDNNLVVMHLTYVHEREGYGSDLSSVSFYLFQKKLITIRQQSIVSFEKVRNTVLINGECHSGAEIGFLLVSERIDHAAKKMKEMIRKISDINYKINYQKDFQKQVLIDINEQMEYLLMFRIAMMNKELTLSHLLMIQGQSDENKSRISNMRDEVKSLLDYSAFNINRLDFMLSSFSANISIEQNNHMKVFTKVAVSVAPATLLAGIFGMNFRVMPELEWQYGYLYALTLMVIITILAVVWFNRVK